MKPGERVLGVEGGGTKTAWVLAETVADTLGSEFRILEQGKLPASNFRLTAPERLRAILAELPKEISRAGVFLAGCATEEDLHALALNNFDELVRWMQTADKMEIAMLAPVVFEAAAGGDARTIEIIEDGARVLCEYTEAVADRLHLLAPKVVLIGGLFYRDSIYTHAFRRRLKKNLPDARVAAAERAPELGAAWLAAEAHERTAFHQNPSQIETVPKALVNTLTEQRNPRSESLEQMNPQTFVQLCIEEEKFVQDALRTAAADLARAIEIVTESLRSGGRLFYIGAGSSGRIGVLDASEIPPTFGAPTHLVQGVIAGGITALHRR